MKLFGGISFDDGGISSSLRAMHLQSNMMQLHNQNVAGFNKVGYQRKVPVVSSFTEFLGTHAMSENIDEGVGRIKLTQNPLDLALGSEGYFQVQTEEGMQLTRDGRFKVDKDGNLLNLFDGKVLGIDGSPIKFNKVPQSPDQIKIRQDGAVIQYDPDTYDYIQVGNISVVTTKGEFNLEPNIKQGYVEESNVSLQQEIFSMLPLRRKFSANRQLFLIQSEKLNKTIQELGRA